VAIAIIKDDELVFSRGFGVRELGKTEPVDECTVYAIASCTKAFTAASLAVLVDEKRLRLDDRVSDYLPDFQLYDPYATRELTVRDLLCHRSGLKTFAGDLIWYGTSHSRDEILRRARYIQPAHSFRSQFGYQNILFVAAGKVAEVVSGQSWPDLVRERFFEPLGMADTSTSITQLAGKQNVARPHAERNGVVTPIDYVNVDNQPPAGAINSSVADLSTWIRLQLNWGKHGDRTLISPEMVQEMWTPHTIVPIEPQIARLYPSTHFRAYGLGWFLSDYHGRKIVEHSGGLAGIVTLVTLVPEENLGFVILTNSETSTITVARNTILDIALSLPRSDWLADLSGVKQAELDTKAAADKKLADERAANTHPSLPLEMYAGMFSCDLYGDAVASLEEGRLALRFAPLAGDHVADLDHWHYDTFRLTWRDGFFPPGLLTFTLDMHGRPSDLRIDAPNRDFDFTELEFQRA
jgi:CubicO group peptidase (beta-lactamase class C family)